MYICIVSKGRFCTTAATWSDSLRNPTWVSERPRKTSGKTPEIVAGKVVLVGTAIRKNLLEFGFRFCVFLALVREPFSWGFFEPLGVTDGAVEHLEVSAISLLDEPASEASAASAGEFIAGSENRLVRALVDWCATGRQWHTVLSSWLDRRGRARRIWLAGLRALGRARCL